MSLRAAQNKTREDLERREAVRFKVEEAERLERKKQEKIQKSKQLLLSQIPFETDDIDKDSFVTSEDGTFDDDSEWVDIEEDEVEHVSTKYNTLSLKYFSQECDRYCVSDRAGAKIGNGLLKDLGIVKQGDTDRLICPSKLRRERAKWGAKLDAEASSVKLPGGLYTDGKRVPTLVRETKENKVRVPGRRGKAAYRTVLSTSSKLVIEDHYPVISEPSGQYVTHLTPEDGTALALATLVTQSLCSDQ